MGRATYRFPLCLFNLGGGAPQGEHRGERINEKTDLATLRAGAVGRRNRIITGGDLFGNALLWHSCHVPVLNDDSAGTPTRSTLSVHAVGNL